MDNVVHLDAVDFVDAVDTVDSEMLQAAGRMSKNLSSKHLTRVSPIAVELKRNYIKLWLIVSIDVTFA